MSGMPSNRLLAQRAPVRCLALCFALVTAALAAGCGDTLYDKATEEITVVTVYSTAASFDAAAPSWTARPSMPVPVSGQSGVVAASGRVYLLASGGASALRFDPQAAAGEGEWTQLPDLPIARDAAVAVTVGSLVCLGSGLNGGAPIRFVEVLDDAAPTPAWSRIPIPFSRHECALVGLSDRLLLIGGRDDRGTVQQDIWELRPVTTTAFWRPIGFLSTPRVLPGTFVVDAATAPKVHVVSGGDRDGAPIASEEVIDITPSVVVRAPVAIPTARIAPQIVSAGGKFYVADARTYAVALTQRLDRFDPAGAGTGWTLRTNHPAALSGMSLAALADGRLMTAGGLGSRETVTSTFVYDDALDAWTASSSMGADAFTGFFTLLGGKPFYAGGVRVDVDKRKLKTGDFLGL